MLSSLSPHSLSVWGISELIQLCLDGYFTLQTNLGDTQYLYIDLAITTTVAVLMGWNEAYCDLVPERPNGSLTSGPNLFSIFSQIFISVIVQVPLKDFLCMLNIWKITVNPIMWFWKRIFFSFCQFIIWTICFSRSEPTCIWNRCHGTSHSQDRPTKKK